MDDEFYENAFIIVRNQLIIMIIMVSVQIDMFIMNK